MALSSLSMLNEQKEDGDEMTTKEMIRKRKRMISNRESARRSRLRKQRQVDELTGKVSQLRSHNGQMKATINATMQLSMNVEAENCILRAQLAELSHRLRSLNEMILCYCLNLPAAVESDHQGISYGSCFDIDFGQNGFSMNPLGFPIVSGHTQDAFMR